MTDIPRLAEKICNLIWSKSQGNIEVVRQVESLLSEFWIDARKSAMQEWEYKVTEKMKRIQNENVQMAYTRAAEKAREKQQEYAKYHAVDYEAGAWDTAGAIAAAIEKLREEK